jgi:hypothetical protein
VCIAERGARVTRVHGMAFSATLSLRTPGRIAGHLARPYLPTAIADVEIRQEQVSIRVLEGERIGSETTSQHSDAYSAVVIRLTTGMGITIVSGR